MKKDVKLTNNVVKLMIYQNQCLIKLPKYLIFLNMMIIHKLLIKYLDIYKKQNQKNMCRHDSQIIGVVSKFSNNEIHTNSNTDKLTNTNNVIIFLLMLN